ncbi:EAL domain-containing protein [Yoonia sp. 208BN28-4]|uniref:EAL domain-containing protein n=1 Tax=Yoonia sp. 208BN28-4 TaxID=3126505 RepID=UPI0030A2E11A
MDQITAPAFALGPDLCVQHVNTAMAALLDQRASNAPLADLAQLVQPADLATLQQPLTGDDTAHQVPMSGTNQFIMIAPVIGPSTERVGFFAIVGPQADTTRDQFARWHAILGHIDDGLWDYDAHTKTRYRSEGWRRLRGLDDGDTSRDRREDWLAFIHPDDRTRLDTLTADLLNGKVTTFEITYRERHADGHWIWVASKGKVVRHDADGNVLHIVASNRDITRTKETEDKLRTLETLRERWRISLESAGQGVWDLRLAEGSRYCSDLWCTMRGYTSDNCPQERMSKWFRYIHPDDQLRLRGQIAKLNSGETDEIRFEYREKHKQGHYIWIVSRGRVVERDESGAPAHIIGNDTDITAIKADHDEFDSLSKSLELAVTTARIGIWQFNTHTRIAKWDAQMGHIYGLEMHDDQDMTGMWEKHLHPDDLEPVTKLANHCLRTGKEFNQDFRIVRPDGTIRHVRSRAAQYTDDVGVRRVIGVNWDITEDRQRAEVLRQANALAQKQNEALETARAEMEHSALHDALTGLANRRLLDDAEKSSRGKAVVLHIDLDRFKQINDTLGHAAGDEVIIHVANLLRKHAPQNATVARVGGDEFVILLPQMPADGVLESLADTIITAAAEPLTIKGHACRFGMSVGIATSAEGETGSALFANADMALYLAKNDGRGRYRFFTEDLKIAMQTKNRLADEILAGLQNHEFYCLYQPQFHADTLNLSGVEALVRWRHPDGSMRSPDSFLPVAEELNVVGRIDQMVLDQAIADTLHWQKRGLPVPRMSVNVSARRLLDPDLPANLACLKKAPGEFAFELLESVFLDAHDEQLAANLACIRDLGIDIEVDDFGTGHASIVGLLKLQPNRLKIDRELVSPVDTSAKQRLLIKSIVEIGKLQGIGVVAEGVETPAHIDVLRDLGCDHLQGYGLASPMPRDQLSALLHAAQSNGKYSPYGGPTFVL